jgi:iron complex transport system substrate-binding protein
MARGRRCFDAVPLRRRTCTRTFHRIRLLRRHCLGQVRDERRDLLITSVCRRGPEIQRVRLGALTFYGVHDTLTMVYRRIACLSTEVVETLYLLGAQDCIAGISGFTVYPAQARKEKPKISGFSSARIERIIAVDPDLVIAFSDVQAVLVDQLVKAGLEVHVYNQRDVAGILRMIRSVAALVGKVAAGEKLCGKLEKTITDVARKANRHASRPRVYFEEWDDPLISGIGWVGELVEIAGGVDCFPELSNCPSASQRIIGDALEVVRRAPDIIVASWCGKKASLARIAARPGWSAIPAVHLGHVFEIKSADILAPGPCAITRGLVQLSELIQSCSTVPQPVRARV